MIYDDKTITRFLSKVKICEHGRECQECCWEWQGAKHSGGYGWFFLQKVQKKTIWKGSHRVAWEATHHADIPDGLWCLHHCDNRSCCNPHHLFLGTHQDNMNDMRQKGRGARGEKNGMRLHPERRPWGRRNGAYTHPERMPRGDKNGAALHPDLIPRGEKSGQSKLTKSQVREILSLQGTMSQVAIARKYNVSEGAVRNIHNKKTWRHILKENREDPSHRAERAAHKDKQLYRVADPNPHLYRCTHPGCCNPYVYILLYAYKAKSRSFITVAPRPLCVTHAKKWEIDTVITATELTILGIARCGWVREGS